MHCAGSMTSQALELARRISARRWFAPVLWFAIAFAAAALTVS